MTRQIKFRAWDTNNKKFYDGACLSDYCVQDNGVMTLNHDFGGLGSRMIFVQFTGLLDKNGKEIWEGDIVKHEDSLTPSSVVWDKASCSFTTSDFDSISVNTSHKNEDRDDEIEVIGNIYENPELLAKEV